MSRPSDHFIAIGAAQAIDRVHSIVLAVNRLLEEGIEPETYAAIVTELEQRGITRANLHDAIVNFDAMFNER